MDKVRSHPQNYVRNEGRGRRLAKADACVVTRYSFGRQKAVIISNPLFLFVIIHVLTSLNYICGQGGGKKLTKFCGRPLWMAHKDNYIDRGN